LQFGAEAGVAVFWVHRCRADVQSFRHSVSVIRFDILYFSDPIGCNTPSPFNEGFWRRNPTRKWRYIEFMAAVTEIGTLIDRDPAVRGGRPKIAGTGLSVSRIAGWYRMGLSPEEIALEYPHLTLAQVHGALAYYHANREEIEADLAQEEAAALNSTKQSDLG